ncbi:pyridoxamine 5'-phosphate oxidase family protein [Cellulomonas sp. URHD0024]|uniref:pyridoxamine 5'-phosphate oxidase family protein n=1 Tax=Cellulomonas sp. URHD0024 TaxID=1302620 RepID=UPI00040D6F6A|nr:pyridoxamine 5'-phosphate oxidase family protein [Cellulomonas sp. URHD0024]
MAQPLPVDDETRIRRIPERQRTERAELYAILDAGLVAHVAFVREGRPVVIPFLYARDGDSLLLHGSTGAGLFLAPEGVEVSVGVTHVDGLVFARSVFDSSANYRSVVVHGRAVALVGDEKEAALLVVSEHLMPGRWDEVRASTRKELAATSIMRVGLGRASVKVRAYGASEQPDDGEDRSVWAGVLPLALVAGAPQPSSDAEVPASVRAATAKFTSAAIGSGTVRL